MFWPTDEREALAIDSIDVNVGGVEFRGWPAAGKVVIESGSERHDVLFANSIASQRSENF